MGKTDTQTDLPLLLFVDTSVFRQLNFDFAGRLLSTLVRRIQSNDISLVLPDVIVREIRHNLKIRILGAEQDLAKFRRSASVLTSVGDDVLSSFFRDLDWSKILDEAQNCIDQFLSSSQANLLPVEHTDGARVLDDYFEGRPPFGSGKKKSEFPDSFAARALLRYSEELNQQVAVVSTDGDWEALCKNHDELIFFDSLPKAIEHSIARRPLTPDDIWPMLSRHTEEIYQAVVELFHNGGFYWCSEDGYDGDVEDVFAGQVHEMTWSIIDQDDNWAVISGDATICYYAHVSHPDPGMTGWDSEDQRLIVMGYERLELFAKAGVPISFRICLPKLRDGELDIEDLDVNESDDIWIDDYEVQGKWSPRGDEGE